MTTLDDRTTAGLNVAPGSVVSVRDEDWLVTSTSFTASGTLIKVQGLSELVRDTEAAFYSDLDEIQVVDPRRARVVADDSPNYRKSRLFLETTLRKTPMPATSNALSVSTRMLSKQLNYQRIAVAKALDPANIRPRILIADAVGLGKTLEIGMILAELVARGRGDNILIVTPRHVLEQMQHEMWTRFALPFVRLDSVGIQRVRQTIPASRNPFTYFKRAIISIDTLKTPRYREHLKKRRWDAVVIDESHNLTNAGTLNNELARILAPRTDALILASATPHNGKKESFAELVRLLDPTAVRPDGSIDKDAVQQLIVRRHRYSDEVATEVGADWAERPAPQNKLVPASPAENAVASELSATWIHPLGNSPAAHSLFGWTLAKAFLSSPAALVETITERLRKLGRADGSPGATAESNPAGAREADALEKLLDLAIEARTQPSAKFSALVDHLKRAGVGKGQPTRAVVFAERVATLKYLEAALPEALGLKEENIGLLHGGLSDVEQQDIVEQFKRGGSPLRVLVTGDVASEGVNLHAECHHLVHFDIPWSLIRIEQRNGRIDRYGQKHPPQIATLVLDPAEERFSGDIRILTRLIEKEHEAHQVFNDVAALMGKNSVEAEEKAIREVLMTGGDLEAVAPSAADVELDELEELLKAESAARAAEDDDADAPAGSSASAGAGVGSVTLEKRIDLYPTELDYLREALEEAFGDPQQKVGWIIDERHGIAALDPTPDLKKRLRFLPQDYLKERRVTERLQLATTIAAGQTALDAARKSDESNWPASHFLGPLHPVLDWASDRALASVSRNEVLAVRGEVEDPTYLMLGTITNRRGQLLNRTFIAVSNGFPSAVPDLTAFLKEAGFVGRPSNPGPVPVDELQAELTTAVDQAEGHLTMTGALLAEDAVNRLEAWLDRAARWSAESRELVQRAEVRDRQDRVRAEQELAQDMRPEQQLVRPLLVIVPRHSPGVATAESREEN
ncbi:helicase-related protein [Zafaria sp. Z1313]|uniref:helicase-related protein n=1 Tax=Zafaria sp. Z1313 TaxID=3423202 RepID=UPI003D3032CF